MDQKNEIPLNMSEVLWLLKNPDQIRVEQAKSQFEGNIDRWIQLGTLNRFLKRHELKPALTKAS